MNTLTFPMSKVRIVRVVEIISAVVLLPFRKRFLNVRSREFKILFVEPFGFGDVVSLSAAFDPIFEAFPDAEIHVLTHPRNVEIFAGDIRVAKTHVAPIPWAGHYHEKDGGFAAIRETFRIAKEIRRLKVDVAIDPRGDFRSQLLMVLCGCRIRAGFTNYLVNSNIVIRGLLLNRNYGRMENLHRFEINRRIAEFALGVKLQALTLPCFAERETLSDGKVVVHPFGGWEGKSWALDHWMELLGSLRGYEVILCGTEAELSGLKTLSTEAGCGYQVTSVAELVNLMGSARLFIGLDSGPMNLASAMGIPVVALFGPGDSERWRPLSLDSRCIHHILECTPCVQKKCSRPGNSCMDQISVEEVLSAVLEVLSEG